METISDVDSSAAAQHAGGNELLAVAEGDAERQPDAAVLAHIFSCKRCSENLREIRQGLVGLAANLSPSSAPQPLDAAPAKSLAEDESDAAIERARRLVWKVALIGVLLALGLIYLRSSAARLG